MQQPTPTFGNLEPALIFNGLEKLGFRFSNLWQPLNSYENRVIQTESKSGEKWILKIYRPARWTPAAIQEEHNFLFELDNHDVRVLTPYRDGLGHSLFDVGGFLVALFPFANGTLCDELLPQDLNDLARLVAMVHEIGRDLEFKHRPILSAEREIGFAYLDLITPFIYPDLVVRYQNAASDTLALLHHWLADVPLQRIHGDLHRGNLLLCDDGFTLLDFDDCSTGPVVQDGWMLFSGDDNPAEMEAWLSGYNEISSFPEEQMEGKELLRGLRIVQSSAWIARRWEDPNFPSLFSRFRDFNYWAEETEALEKILRENS